MKKIYCCLLLSLICFSSFSQHSLEKIWETSPVIATPESVLPDLKKGILYISLIDGAPWEADGKGGVAILKLDGTIVDTAFITGLNAPKGMGQYKKRLYIADINQVVVVDIKKKQIEKKIPVDSAVALNDISVDDNGVVFVSDSKTGKVHKLQKDQVTLYASGLEGLNGLKCIGSDLYALSGKSFVKIDAQQNRTTLASLIQGGDGMEPIGNGDFIASSWVGLIYYVTKSGQVDILLDSREQKKNTADIGYDPATRILYVPTFNAKTVVAYKVK
ncbi:MAG TPA: hypothetical protein VLC98_17760 [Phnomibacter sp.]|nr:hypothetical protein [Phnomibacter sp.]